MKIITEGMNEKLIGMENYQYNNLQQFLHFPMASHKTDKPSKAEITAMGGKRKRSIL